MKLLALGDLPSPLLRQINSVWGIYALLKQRNNFLESVNRDVVLRDDIDLDVERFARLPLSSCLTTFNDVEAPDFTLTGGVNVSRVWTDNQPHKRFLVIVHIDLLLHSLVLDVNIGRIDVEDRMRMIPT